MNGYHFSERVRNVLAISREEAVRLRHEYVGTEHLLLGLIREGNGVGAAVLGNLGIDLDQLRQTVESMVQWGTGPTPGPDLPYTSRAKQALELTMAEAEDLHHSYIGTEHLLLGLMRAERGPACASTCAAGATLDVVRAETLRVLGTDNPRTQPDATAPEG